MSLQRWRALCPRPLNSQWADLRFTPSSIWLQTSFFKPLCLYCGCIWNYLGKYLSQSSLDIVLWKSQITLWSALFPFWNSQFSDMSRKSGCHCQAPGFFSSSLAIYSLAWPCRQLSVLRTWCTLCPDRDHSWAHYTHLLL